MPAATPYPLICSNNLSDVPRPDVAIATLSQGGLAAPTFVDGEPHDQHRARRCGRQNGDAGAECRL